MRALLDQSRLDKSPDAADFLKRLMTGYAALKRGDYQRSWEAFQEYAQPGSYLAAFEPSYSALPYHAYVAAKTGHAEEFSAYLEKWSKRLSTATLQRDPPPYPEFDVHLARAVLASIKGSHDKVKEELSLARGSMAEPGARPLPLEYVFAEVCELLGKESGKREYFDIAVDWARAYQVYEPWAAWAYAFEAMYGKNDADRARAYAIAQYLDRNSSRISAIDASIASRAKLWLAANKPFPRERNGGPHRKAL